MNGMPWQHHIDYQHASPRHSLKFHKISASPHRLSQIKLANISFFPVDHVANSACRHDAGMAILFCWRTISFLAPQHHTCMDFVCVDDLIMMVTVTVHVGVLLSRFPCMAAADHLLACTACKCPPPVGSVEMVMAVEDKNWLRIAALLVVSCFTWSSSYVHSQLFSRCMSWLYGLA